MYDPSITNPFETSLLHILWIVMFWSVLIGTVRNGVSCSKILDSLMDWLGEKRKTEFSWTQANQAMSESRIFERIQPFLRYSGDLILKKA